MQRTTSNRVKQGMATEGKERSHRVVRWLSPKYRKLAVPVSVIQNIELFAHTRALSVITIIFIPDKEPKYRTFRLNTGYLATLRPHKARLHVGVGALWHSRANRLERRESAKYKVGPTCAVGPT